MTKLSHLTFFRVRYTVRKSGWRWIWMVERGPSGFATCKFNACLFAKLAILKTT